MSAGSTRVNICFHGIGTPGRTLEPGEDRYWVDEDLYAAVLDQIATWPSVAISFDDGNATDLDQGLQPLLDRGLTATFFVLAGRLDQPGSLSADGVRTLRDAGMTIGTHGHDHRPWTGASDAELHRELIQARATVADVVGSPVTEAALPLGRYDRRVLRALRDAGYDRVFSSDRRTADPAAWFQPRFSVRADDTPQALCADVDASRQALGRAKGAIRGLVKRLR